MDQLAIFDSDLACQINSATPHTNAPIIVSETTAADGLRVPKLTGEYWTSGQRQASPIHEVSYRACFKPQLPAYFIRRFTKVGDLVLDPFSGRGTTVIEAALMGRCVVANDANPLSAMLAEPRLNPPTLNEVEDRLLVIPKTSTETAEQDLTMFFHPETQSEIVALRAYLARRKEARLEDSVDRWIRMVATNRLTGHSPGFFSVYTFPPNQAVSATAQVRINEKRKQSPPYRDTHALILRKSKQLLKAMSSEQLNALRKANETARWLNGDAGSLSGLDSNSVQLTVTSPPFLDVVHYADDNWLRGWFNQIPINQVANSITLSRTVEDWCSVMTLVFRELWRVTRPGGWIAFEVGEVRKGSIRLEEHVIPLGTKAGFRCEAVLINEQTFTKTANLWGVTNNKQGTNSNRMVVFQKDRA